MGIDHEEHPIKRITQFINEIDTESPLVLFRGQPVDEPLVPKIARPFLVTSNQTKKQAYIDKVVRREDWMISEFQRQAMNLDDRLSLSSDLGDVLSVAQHYGLPTRLLDWTQNPLAALFFAVDYDRKKEENPRPVIWQLVPDEDEQLIKPSDRKKFNFRAPDQTMVFRPNHVTTRIRVQSGWFTVHVLGKRMNKLGSFKGNLKKFVIEADPDDLLRRLDRMGVNRASLFPDTANLASYLEWSCPHTL